VADPKRTLRGKWGWLALATLVTVADLWTKDVIFGPLREGQVDFVLGRWFGVTKVWNSGMMWGALQGYGEPLRILRLVAAVVVFGMILSTPARSRMLLLALALVLGGALGNIYDGFQYGRVRDFLLVDLDVRFFDPFPVFNVADSAICVGVGLLALGLVLDGKERPEEEPRRRPAADAASE